MTVLTNGQFLLVAILTVASGVANADLYDDYINSTSKKPFVAFLARTGAVPNSFTGHAFVALGVDLDSNTRVYERIIGYYPKDTSTLGELKATFTRVSGSLTSTLPDVVWSTEYRVSINDTQHRAALTVIDKWMSSDPQYNVLASGGKNCNSFVSAVASAIGLKVPDGAGTTFPPNFIATLKKAN